MAAVTEESRSAPALGPARHAPGGRRAFPVWRWVVLIVAGAYFLIPLYGALKFSGFAAFGNVVSAPGFTGSLWLSVRLAIVTTVITLVLMVPTTVYVHLRLPKVRRVLESVTILPIVIPPVVLVIGLLQIAPPALAETPYLLSLEYVVLAMPFAYRTIDAGVRSMDVKTLTEASNSLGAGWLVTLWRVILPNLSTALLSATVLTVALVLGEYTMATLDLTTTFPVWIVNNDQTSAPTTVAASLLSLFVTWLFLMAITVAGTRQARRTGRGEVNLFSVTTTTQTIGES